MKRIILLLVSYVMAWGQAGPGVLAPRRAISPINLYLATTGSDSNNCLSSSTKCLTLAHVLTLIPQVLDNRYVINISDGTYSEPVNTTGFIGTGLFKGPNTTSIELLGNTTTPSNVVFNGTVNCLPDYTGFTSTGCFAGSAHIILHGLKLSNSGVHYVSICNKGVLEYNGAVVSGSGTASDESIGIAHFDCDWVMNGNLTINGFNTDIGPAFGIGLYNSIGGSGVQESGTLTITGPGTSISASAFVTYCFVIEQGARSFQIHGSSSIAISGCQQGIVINDNSNFSAFDGGATIALSNGTTTPTSSQGIVSNGGGTFNSINNTVTIDHYTTCVQANQGTVVSTTGGTATLTNCTAHGTTNGGQVLGF